VRRSHSLRHLRVLLDVLRPEERVGLLLLARELIEVNGLREVGSDVARLSGRLVELLVDLLRHLDARSILN